MVYGANLYSRLTRNYHQRNTRLFREDYLRWMVSKKLQVRQIHWMTDAMVSGKEGRTARRYETRIPFYSKRSVWACSRMSLLWKRTLTCTYSKQNRKSYVWPKSSSSYSVGFMRCWMMRWNSYMVRSDICKWNTIDWLLRGKRNEYARDYKFPSSE